MNIIENKRGIGYFVNDDAQKIILESKKQDFFSKVLPDFLRHAEVLGITALELTKYLGNLNSKSWNCQRFAGRFRKETPCLAAEAGVDAARKGQ